MGLLRKLIGLRLKSSSIIEVTTAMVLIVTIFLMSSIVMINVSSGMQTVKEVATRQRLNEILLQTRRSGEFIDKEIIEENLVIHQVVKPYENNPALLNIQIEASLPDGTFIDQLNQLVYVRR